MCYLAMEGKIDSKLSLKLIEQIMRCLKGREVSQFIGRGRSLGSGGCCAQLRN